MQEGFLIVGRGLGQVMFQNNAVSGLLMLVGIACNSWLLALLALLGNFVGTVTAFFSGYSKEDIEDGLYGFNGTLVGIAVGVFMEPGVASLLLLVAGSMLSTWIARVFAYQKLLPGFTAPFILAVWLLQALCRGWFPSLLSSSVMPEETAADWFRAFSLNIGQVMFQGGTVLSGLFFLAGILLNSRVHALYTVWGALWAWSGWSVPIMQLSMQVCWDITLCFAPLLWATVPGQGQRGLHCPSRSQSFCRFGG